MESFDTLADLPGAVSSFLPLVPTPNDFVNIRNDENHDNATTRYIITQTDPAMKYGFDIILNTDATGAMALVPGANQGDIAIFDTEGQVENIPVSDLISPSGNTLIVDGNGLLRVPPTPLASGIVNGVLRVANGSGLNFVNGNLSMNLASNLESGAMSAEDKIKLDGIGEGSNADRLFILELVFCNKHLKK